MAFHRVGDVEEQFFLSKIDHNVDRVVVFEILVMPYSTNNKEIN